MTGNQIFTKNRLVDICNEPCKRLELAPPKQANQPIATWPQLVGSDRVLTVWHKERWDSLLTSQAHLPFRQLLQEIPDPEAQGVVSSLEMQLCFLNDVPFYGVSLRALTRVDSLLWQGYECFRVTPGNDVSCICKATRRPLLVAS